MAGAKVALQGKVLKGRIDFAAATEGSLLLDKGGGWKADSYAAQVFPLPRTLNRVDISTVQNSTLYRLIIDGKNVDFTSDASATATEIRDGLIAAIAASGLRVTGVIVDADSLDIRGTVPGENHTVAQSAALMTLGTPTFETIPSLGVLKENGRVRVRASAAWTGAVDVIVQG
jgi:hypothetical protein